MANVEENGVNPRSSTASGGSNHMLSDKVTRALEVRTDTPAMVAALDALSHMQHLDARSVRVAIEQDALEQALLFETELRKLVETVGSLKSSIVSISNVAHEVTRAIHTNVLLPPNDNATSKNDSSVIGSHDPAAANAMEQSTDSSALEEEEERLAELLSDAFREREEAARRSEIVQTFLDKFDLSQAESHLLDHYSFEDFFSGAPGAEQQALSFLDALERVRIIRTELSKTFGPDTTGISSSSAHTLESALQDDIDSSEDPSNSISVRSSHRRLGATSAIRMMEHLAAKQERAYERLYQFLQRYLSLAQQEQQQEPHDEDDLDDALMNPLIRRSLQVLKHVPAFYSHTLELIASNRRSQVTRRFLLALTTGHGSDAPIERMAHDPNNYVGDMLAFCFRTMNVESELARGLVSYNTDENKESAHNTSDTNDSKEDKEEEEEKGDDDLLLDKPMEATDVLAHAVSGISRPLKSRISQVIASLARRGGQEEQASQANDLSGPSFEYDDEEEESVAARSRIASIYSIAGLLLFYQSAMTRTIQKISQNGENNNGNTSYSPQDDKINPLMEAVSECLEEASDAFALSLKVYGAMLQEYASLSPGDTESSLTHAMIAEIVELRVASPGFSIDVICPTSLSLEYLCDTLLDAVLPSLCQTLDDAVQLKRALTVTKRAGLSPESVSKWESSIGQHEKSMAQDLIDSETQQVLDICGLKPLKDTLDQMQLVYIEGMTCASHPGLSLQEVTEGLKEFYSSLYSPPLPSFDYIKDPVLRKYSRSQTAQKVFETYQELYTTFMGEMGGYENTSFLGHSPDQVKTLLSL